MRLKPIILTFFLVLTVPVLLAIIALTYVSNDSTARDDANTRIAKAASATIADIRNDIDPIRSMVASAATLGDTDPAFYDDNGALPYLASLLDHSHTVISVYVGLEDGSFRQAIRVDPSILVHGEPAPADTVYARRWIDRSGAPGSEGPATDHYEFYDAADRPLGSAAAENPYDPRRRGWYASTAAAAVPIITDPDVFAVRDLIGFTVAAPFRRDGVLHGVIAADITLAGLSAYLATTRISPGSLSYILDANGDVLAASDLTRSYTNRDGKVALRHVTALDDTLPAAAFVARPHGEDGVYSFRHDGGEYVASLATLPEDFGKRWQYFSITPVDDFTGPFTRNNLRLVAIGLAALFVQIVVILLVAGRVSAPLERLAAKVDRLQMIDTETDVQPEIVSPVQEIATLAKAVDTLDRTVASFAAFVPVGLVNQLLASDQKLELGGHSRFLTIFTSDIEGFSTLSEDLPAQDVLFKVSAYLEIVTNAINAESGTIDKFIGDGVLAFWGAPALLDDHALLACTAALRIQREMAALNARWQAEGSAVLNVRIGIHCDAVLVGNIGSKSRMSYTVLGDGVNIAARLEGINKEYGTRLCISHNVYKEAGDRLCVRPIEEVTVKGRRASILIYELCGVICGDPVLAPDTATLRLCEMTRQAHEAAARGEVEDAAAHYRAILAEFPDDPVAASMLRRLDGAPRAVADASRGDVPRSRA